AALGAHLIGAVKHNAGNLGAAEINAQAQTHAATLFASGSYASAAASSAPQSPSNLSSSSSSARVLPRLMAASGRPCLAAARAKRNPDHTIRDEPTTSMASACSNCCQARAIRALSTTPPKNTTSGLSTPPQTGQGGTLKA